MIPLIPSILSIFGSSAIVYMVFSDYRKKLLRPKNRLMVMMSLFDILSSTAFGLSKVAMPSDMGVSGAMGNSHTCTAQGIFIWLGMCVPLYNSSLNLFYLLSIKYNIRAEHFSQKIEPFLHLISISIPLSIAIILALRGDLVPWGNVCVGNSRHVAILLVCCTAPCILFCIFSMASIYSAVRQRTQIMRRYSHCTITNVPRILDESETRKQALLYASAFVLTFIFPTIQAVIRSFGSDTKSNVLVIMSGIFYPLQGFWNFLLYIRPGVQRIREIEPNLCWIEAVRQVVFNVRTITERVRQAAQVNEDDIEDDIPDEISSSQEVSDAKIDGIGLNKTEIISVSGKLSCTDESSTSNSHNERRRSLVQLATVLSQLSFDDVDEEDSSESSRLHNNNQELNL